MIVKNKHRIKQKKKDKINEIKFKSSKKNKRSTVRVTGNSDSKNKWKKLSYNKKKLLIMVRVLVKNNQIDLLKNKINFKPYKSILAQNWPYLQKCL